MNRLNRVQRLVGVVAILVVLRFKEIITFMWILASVLGGLSARRIRSVHTSRALAWWRSSASSTARKAEVSRKMLIADRPLQDLV